MARCQPKSGRMIKVSRLLAMVLMAAFLVPVVVAAADGLLVADFILPPQYHRQHHGATLAELPGGELMAARDVVILCARRNPGTGHWGAATVAVASDEAKFRFLVMSIYNQRSSTWRIVAAVSSLPGCGMPGASGY